MKFSLFKRKLICFLFVFFRPNLVSLDLSFNDLTDLFNLVSTISTLQNLRVLMLQGNPLTFLTTYRSYIIDCLPKLSVLDDILILPDEKYKFSGLSKKKGEILANDLQLENTNLFFLSIRLGSRGVFFLWKDPSDNLRFLPFITLLSSCEFHCIFGGILAIQWG